MKSLLTFIVLAVCAFQLNAQHLKINGKVTDETGLPLPGVIIAEKETPNKVQSDFDGEFVIEIQIGNTLEFSYVGYATIEIPTTASTKDLAIQMNPVVQALEEVVVTAQGIKKEAKALSYSVSKVTSESINSRNYKDVARVLSGKVSGVQISSQSGTTGSATNVVIRGYSSLPNTENESYARIKENVFKRVESAPLSTFSIDVDKAGYSNVRRMINNGQEVPADAVKIEEMINYFAYDYPEPTGSDPFSINTEIANSPWNKKAKLVRIGLKGKDITSKDVPNSNLVFLLDVSGSMDQANKLPLLKSALHILVDKLRNEDKVSIVVYAGAAGVVLEPTRGSEKEEILAAIDRLNAGGSTAGGRGIKLAYSLAEKNFIKGGNNRIILATDGDFNVGASSDKAMEELIVEKRKSGVFLTVLGFGMGDYKDSKMETLADKGNGNHAYIDTMQEAHKVLGTEFFGTLYTIAKDVKIQVEFNPQKVKAYRLVGYENRLLNDEDFIDDKKDAGELGSGHTVTALYEVIPRGVDSKHVGELDNLKYSKTYISEINTNEILTVKFRYKEPDGETSKLIVKAVTDNNMDIEYASTDFKFSAAVALYGLQLRKSIFTETFEKSDVIDLAKAGKGEDVDGYRAEFIRLVRSY